MNTPNRWFGLAWVACLLALVVLMFQLRLRHGAQEDYDAAARQVEQLEAKAYERRTRLAQGHVGELAKKVAAQGSAPAVQISEERKNEIMAANRKKQAVVEIAQRQQTVRRLVDLEINIRPRFEALGLSAAQWDEYQKLQLEAFDAQLDGDRASRKGSANPQEVVKQSTANVEERVRKLVGSEAYEELEARHARQGDGLWLAVRNLANHLIFSDTPLGSDQAESLYGFFQQHSEMLRTSGGVVLPDSLLRQLGGLLSPPQVAAWQRLQGANRLAQRQIELSRPASPPTGKGKAETLKF